ncbi:cache domain-containing sensor histidine kinase [Paenibacillus hexagrammi]|uniref:histidine kinase n=1 Tax=Paenibacillus hexagrammi TaxID=2908839 RepID=A0ABY3SLH1_9BACL|nr:sensor histidine kinase [Paenibacillus sp. YPD9-1]UJF34564.1 sensor histidine kinase [Paenibacillus sp. YPD9-1]
MEFVDLTCYNVGEKQLQETELMPMIKNSIRNKLILFLLAATLIPFATSMMVTYWFTKEKVTEDTIRNNSALMLQGKTNVINYLNSVVQASLTVYSNYNSSENFYDILDHKKVIDYTSDKVIKSSLQVMSHSIKEIQQIYLYAKESNMSYLMVNEKGTPSYGKYKELPNFPEGRDVYFDTTHQTHSYGVMLTNYFSPFPVISMHRKIINFAESRVLGELVIDLNMNLITDITKDLYEPGEEDLYILDETGRIIFGPDPAAWGQLLNQDWAKEALASTLDSGSYEWKKGSYAGVNQYEKMKTDFVDWTLVKRVPYAQLYKNARQLTIINTAILSLFLIIAVAGTIYISIRFTEPIKQLIRYITRIQSGQLNTEIDLLRSDELGILANRFHTLIQDLNQMVLKEYRLELANKSNQLMALQAQINPHFLNNALQSIGTLALQHEVPQIYKLISSLAKMMRYSMNTSESIVPLRQELDHVKSYLELQKQRFEQQFDISLDIEDSTYSIPIPKMILQPLVENYFKHGFKPSLGTGHLRIHAAKLVEQHHNVLYIEVEDNGQGMSEERIQEVRRCLKATSTSEDGIGLCNVLLRIRLYYSDEAELQLCPVEPQGLKIIITIPLQKEHNQ